MTFLENVLLHLHHSNLSHCSQLGGVCTGDRKVEAGKIKTWSIAVGKHVFIQAVKSLCKFLAGILVGYKGSAFYLALGGINLWI